MRWIRVTLTLTDAAQQISALAALTSKKSSILQFVIYAEDGNNVDATNGPARIGDANVDRVAAGGVKGIPLLPGIINDAIGQSVGGAVAPYSFDLLYLMGASGDVFQIGYTLP